MNKKWSLHDIKFNELKNSSSFKAERHGFHIVEPSPWPLAVSISLTNLIMLVLLYFNYFVVSWWEMMYSMLLLSFSMGFWFRDMVIESTFQGMHTVMVQQMHSAGFVLVMISESFFFFGFFWCFFYMAISPSMWIGCTWPPYGIEPMNPLGLPLWNTIILLSSGVTATFSHSCILSIDGRSQVSKGLVCSILFGILFTYLQLLEYTKASFSMNDGIYGSIFFVSTGFHGLHVIVGTIALLVCLIRHLKYHFQMDHHVGLELSVWYWHFVDIIWMLLYFSIYVWGYRWN